MSSGRSEQIDEIIALYISAIEQEGPQDHDQWVRKYPDFEEELRSYFEDDQWLTEQARALEPTEIYLPETVIVKKGQDSLGHAEYEIGQLIAGKYRVLGTNRGGMGRVYMVNGCGNTDSTPRAVMKTLLPYQAWVQKNREADGAGLRARYTAMLHRFRREAMIWIGLREHKNVIRAALVEEIAGRPFLFLEYANEGCIADWIKADKLDLERSIDFATQFCSGMTHVSKKSGVVHRDIKPANILVNDGIVKVADFGLAGIVRDMPRSDLQYFDPATSDSQVGAGTMSYMAPEQFLSLAQADTRSDIFSTGATLFEMLTGCRLFHKVNAFESAHQNLPLPSLNDFGEYPESVSRIVKRCVEYAPANRYSSFVELGKDLLRCGVSTPWRLVKGRPDGEPEELTNQSRSLRSNSLNALGMYDEAIQDAETAIERDEDFYGHWVNRGKGLAEQGQYDEAYESYNRARQLAPEKAVCWYNVAYCLSSMDQPGEGLIAARQAKQLDPQCSSAWDAEGCCLAELGDTQNAIKSFRNATIVDAHNWRAFSNLGRAFQLTESYAQARDCLTTAIELNPNAMDAHDHLIEVYVLTCEWDDAIDAVDRALALDETRAKTWALRGTLYASMPQSLENLEIADASFERAVQIDSTLGHSPISNLFHGVRTELKKRLAQR